MFEVEKPSFELKKKKNWKNSNMALNWLYDLQVCQDNRMKQFKNNYQPNGQLIFQS